MKDKALVWLLEILRGLVRELLRLLIEEQRTPRWPHRRS